MTRRPDASVFLSRIVRGVFQQIHKPKKPKKKKEYVRFVYKGNFYRRQITASKKSKEPPQLLKIPAGGQRVVPQPFKSLENEIKNAKQKGQSWSWQSWLKLNAPLLVLNFGSLATLLGFTRTDVLELRTLSMTGSTAFVIYQYFQPPPIKWGPIIWSSLFASVNGFKIASILNERKGAVVLSEHEEEIFHEHFEPHGVTPKQFEKVMSMGKTIVVKKGEPLCRQGEQLTSVKLVVRGHTRANVLGRHLTAIGSSPGNKDKNPGGDSGAWVGEMAFLQSMWDKDHASKGLQKKHSKPKSSEVEKDSNATESESHPVLKSGTSADYKYCAISTVVAVEDIEVIEWSFKDMEAIMKTSVYTQSALTRAMTAAVVGKVVNFMVSRSTALPTWATWLDNWKHSSPRTSKMAGVLEEEEEEENRTVHNVEKVHLSYFQMLQTHGM